VGKKKLEDMILYPPTLPPIISRYLSRHHIIFHEWFCYRILEEIYNGMITMEDIFHPMTMRELSVVSRVCKAWRNHAKPYMAAFVWDITKITKPRYGLETLILSPVQSKYWKFCTISDRQLQCGYRISNECTLDTLTFIRPINVPALVHALAQMDKDPFYKTPSEAHSVQLQIALVDPPQQPERVTAVLPHDIGRPRFLFIGMLNIRCYVTDPKVMMSKIF
jgi:hypothetical protein